MSQTGGTTGVPIPQEGYNYGFDELPEPARLIVVTVKERLADSMDNEERGVWLAEVSGFNDDRMAMLFSQAIRRINARLSNPGSFTAINFPYRSQVGTGAAIASLMVECVKHLIVSYTEQPNVSSVGAPLADRTSYTPKWMDILRIFEEELKEHLAAFNREIIFGGDTLSGGMKVLVGNSSRFADYGRMGRPTPRTWMGI